MRIMRLAVVAALFIVSGCSKSDKAEEPKKSPLLDLVKQTTGADSASTFTPLLQARGFKIVSVQKVPAQLSSRRANVAVYRSSDGAEGGVVYMQRMVNSDERVTWHWYFNDGAPDSVQFAEINGDGLWDVRVFMAGGTTRDFVQGESFTFMTDRSETFAMNGASSGTDAWKAFDGDTTTVWESPAKGAFVEVALPMGYEEGKLRVKVAEGRANKIDVFAGDRKAQSASLKDTRAYQEIALDASLKDAPAIRIVVEGPSQTVAISEMEIR